MNGVYNKKAKCPYFLKFLGEILHKDYHPALQEWFGYVLVADTRAHKMAVLTGVPRSGKSTLINLLVELVGREIVAPMSMRELTKGFALENAIGKLFMPISDAPKKLPGSVEEMLKSISGGDPICIDRKYKPVISDFSLKTRIMIACNQLPSFYDPSGALAKRMLCFRFNNSFAGKEDRYLFARLQKEKSGIANWAIDGIKRLQKNNFQFSESSLAIAERAQAAEEQSPITAFAQECLFITNNEQDAVSLMDIQRAYEKWVEDTGREHLPCKSQVELFQRFKNYPWGSGKEAKTF